MKRASEDQGGQRLLIGTGLCPSNDSQLCDSASGFQSSSIFLKKSWRYFKNNSKFEVKKMINWTLHIGSDTEKLFGKPVIINTRIPVDLILEKLAVSDSFDDLLDAYPKITRDDIAACLMFAADSVKNEIIISKAS